MSNSFDEHPPERVDDLMIREEEADHDQKLDQLVHGGVFRSRAEAAAFLIDEGIKVQTALFERVEQKLSEIERLRAELRGIVNNQQGNVSD